MKNEEIRIFFFQNFVVRQGFRVNILALVFLTNINTFLFGNTVSLVYICKILYFKN